MVWRREMQSRLKATGMVHFRERENTDSAERSQTKLVMNPMHSQKDFS